MQIQGDYHSFSGREYQNTHTHHFTKCLHEEEYQKKEGASAGMRQDTLSSASGQKEEQEKNVDFSWATGSSAKGLKRGISKIKGIWNAMGEEDAEKAEKSAVGSITGKETPVYEGVEGASSAIRLRLPDRIVNKWESLRMKIKAGVKSALKRFGREQDTFGALSDPKGRFAGKKGAEHQYDPKANGGTRKGSPDILTADMSDTHLMDSYSKNGEYCRLNENLTYQKKSM